MDLPITETAGIAILDGTAVGRLLPMKDAIDVIEEALREGLSPEGDPHRSVVAVTAGQILLMPSALAGYAGIKLVTVAPANPSRGLPRVQGVYLLVDGSTLTPLALIDGIALTSLRTPAVSGVAVRWLSPLDACRLVIFGTGPQAWGHVEAVRQVRAVSQVTVVGRTPERAASFVDKCRAAAIPAEAGIPSAVAEADIVCCCTSSREPLFDGSLVASHAVVVAMGSYEPNAREVDECMVGRATTVVEARSVATHEAGDVIQAVKAGVCAVEFLTTLDEVIRGIAVIPPDRPRLFKSVGMAWEDLVTASTLYQRWLARKQR